MSSPITHAIFDLDGTIANSLGGIAASFQATMKEWNIEVPPEVLPSLIGPPLWTSFSSLGIAPDRVDTAVARYREHYQRMGVTNAVAYDGVVAVVHALHDDGVRLAVATAKRVDFARAMLANFGIDHLFDVIAGASLDLVVQEKSDIIAEVLQYWGPIPRATTVMIGDRRYDIAGARHHDLVGVGVTWGFGDVTELTEAGARYLVHTPAALRSFDSMETVTQHGNV